MKLLSKLFLLLIVLSFVSCSNSSNTTDEVALDEMAVDVTEDPVESAEEPIMEETTDIASLDESQVDAESIQEPGEFQAGNDVMEKVYEVQPNETLMMISFKLYGDYARWKEIANLNGDVLDGSTNVAAGTKLKYLSNGQDFQWNPEGNPYLIKNGDTLGTISDNVYQTPSRWKDIWHNNRPLIKDPDKIFAGFTLYYIPDEKKEVKTEEIAFNSIEQ